MAGKMTTFDGAGGLFTLRDLEWILAELNKTGRATIVGVKPGSVSLVQLGAELALRTTHCPDCRKPWVEHWCG